MSTFDSAFEIVVGIEGNYSNDPNDPGGETKYGISKRAHPSLDIANLTLEDAKAIYKKEYWDVLGLDNEPWYLQLNLFDIAVNEGQNLARSLRARYPYLPDLVVARVDHYWTDPHFERFGHGWLRRVAKIAALGSLPPRPASPTPGLGSP